MTKSDRASRPTRFELDTLFPAVYAELRRLAHRRLRAEATGHTLSTTALVNETYLKLADQRSSQFDNRAHFFALAARAMRRILVDYARRHRAIKRSPGQEPVSLASLERSDAIFAHPSAKEIAQRADLLMAVDEALSQSGRDRRASGSGGGVPLLRGTDRTGNRGTAGGDSPDRGARLGPGEGLADATSPLMNPEFERRLLELVDQALELPAEARASFLHKACAGDSALESAAAELIASCAKAEVDDRFLVDSAAVFADPIIRAVEEEEEEEDSEEPLKRVSALLEGQYKFGREIGRGGNAIVYLARDLQHSRDVAIKVIRQGVADPDRRHRFLREVEISAQLRHPFVIPLIDSGEAQGTLYLRHALRGRGVAARPARP